jgi:peptidoglycan/LPS O-acetylase OafA/YrhL
MGQLSYSLYLFHYGALVAVMTWQPNHDELHGPVSVILYVCGAFGLALISYYLVERPMIAVRRRFGSHRKDMVG